MRKGFRKKDINIPSGFSLLSFHGPQLSDYEWPDSFLNVARIDDSNIYSSSNDSPYHLRGIRYFNDSDELLINSTGNYLLTGVYVKKTNRLGKNRGVLYYDSSGILIDQHPEVDKIKSIKKLNTDGSVLSWVKNAQTQTLTTLESGYSYYVSASPGFLFYSDYSCTPDFWFRSEVDNSWYTAGNFFSEEISGFLVPNSGMGAVASGAVLDLLPVGAELCVNNGTINSSLGDIEQNNWDVISNSGNINLNKEYVGKNYGLININQGKIDTNFSRVVVNSGVDAIILVNSGNVIINSSGAFISGNQKEINLNHGTVNTSLWNEGMGGFITNNSGEVTNFQDKNSAADLYSGNGYVQITGSANSALFFHGAENSSWYNLNNWSYSKDPRVALSYLKKENPPTTLPDSGFVATSAYLSIVPLGKTVIANYGTIKENLGGIIDNLSVLASNRGHVSGNFGILESNYGNVDFNRKLATVRYNFSGLGENHGDVLINSGIITSNYGLIDINLSGATVENNFVNSGDISGIVNANNGNLNSNFGYVSGNKNIIFDNNGTVLSNFNTIQKNNISGLVICNKFGAEILDDLGQVLNECEADYDILGNYWKKIGKSINFENESTRSVCVSKYSSNVAVAFVSLLDQNSFVRVFKPSKSSSSLSQVGQTIEILNNTNYSSGPSICLNSYGNILVVGYLSESQDDLGIVDTYVYNTKTLLWEQFGNSSLTIQEEYESKAFSVAVDNNADTLVAGFMHNLGQESCVHIFKRSSSSWLSIGDKKCS